MFYKGNGISTMRCFGHTIAGCMLVALFCLTVAPSFAFALDIEQLKAAYSSAVQEYEQALIERSVHSSRITELESSIEEAERDRDQKKNEIVETSETLYRESMTRNTFFELILGSSSFYEAVLRYDLYEKIERKCAEHIKELNEQCEAMNNEIADLENEMEQINARVKSTRAAMTDAERALRRSSHTEGSKYHQVQGNGSNCGATAFIVGVNILLGEERFKDNVEVWNGPGFNGDSTSILASRGKAWLIAHHLQNDISIGEPLGDVHKTTELQALLEEGYVVIISSGSGSNWQRADNTELVNGFPDGHWILFYLYEDGIFYANDSSVSADKGAGVPYNEKQMQQWLDGRGNHFTTIMKALK